MITGAKILITGVRGSVGLPLALDLAAENEVWGIARFAEAPPPEDVEAVPWSRASLEAAGITTRAIDLGAGDFDDLPDDFTYVLHLAWQRGPLAELEDVLRTNVEGAGLLLQHCRKARAALVMSGMGIYSGQNDPWHAYSETDPVGRGATAYAATSPASKLGVEAVARFCARAFDLPTVITRLNTFMGTPDSFPGRHIAAVLAGETTFAPHDPTPHTPIHIDDMKDPLEALLDAAATPALITNWCGDETVTAQDWVQRASELSGREGRLEVRAPAPGSPLGTRADPNRRQSITGPCRTVFDDEYRRLFATVSAHARAVGTNG